MATGIPATLCTIVIHAPSVALRIDTERGDARALSWRMPRLPPIASVLFALLPLAACGGGSDAPAPTAPAASAQVSAATSCGLGNFRADVLASVNEYRARGADCGSHGRFGAAPALTWNDALFVAASGHSADMAARDYFSHVSPEGANSADRISAAGYAWRAVAENIAGGPRTVAEVMAGWIDSDGHCANVLNPALREFAVACVADEDATYERYWTMNLGTRR